MSVCACVLRGASAHPHEAAAAARRAGGVGCPRVSRRGACATAAKPAVGARWPSLSRATRQRDTRWEKRNAKWLCDCDAM
jgi:hypothetical protein